jgi:hypothetical protein
MIKAVKIKQNGYKNLKQNRHNLHPKYPLQTKPKCCIMQQA